MTRHRRTAAGRVRRTLVVGLGLAGVLGCAHIGRLKYTAATISPTEQSRREQPERDEARGAWRAGLGPMFADTTIGLIPGTADTAKRYLGRLRQGYIVDTLNIILFGDNRPGWRSTRLASEYYKIRGIFSPSISKIFTGLVNIPFALAKGLWPDLAIVRDIPGRLRHMPTWGPEAKVVTAILGKVDSIQARGGTVAAVVNTGDLVNDGRYFAHWERFLRITQPLYSRVPYFGVAGNHERTDTEDGRENWRTATGLPVGSDRLYYCFDSADGWVRFIALDSNPMVDPGHLWTREAREKFSDEQITWMVARLKEHHGPAFVFMHHPPFSVGFHHDEWQADSVLSLRRDRMVRAMHDAGIAILAAGHVHSYQRALFTWPDAVMVVLVTGGGGAPLHQIPAPGKSAAIFSGYHVAGSVVDPENVVTGSFNHFIHARLWLGGGELHTYAVNQQARATLVDEVHIDLSRYGSPKIDQHKMPIIPKTTPATEQHEESPLKPKLGSVDSVASSKRLLKQPPRVLKQASRDSVAATRGFAADSLSLSKKLKADSLAKVRKPAVRPVTPPPPVHPPSKPPPNP